ncbi:MAG TPA: extracellular solute-binding protein [Tepidisphaeraceae bacterium]|nr:extracellular solute-binding protein [Tepidisphaeraceae bacterium]
MKQYGLIFLFAIVLGTPFVLRAMYGTVSAPSTDALQLVIITPHVEGIRREFAQAFSKWHQEKYGQPVAIDYRNYGGTSSIVKFFEASRPLYDQLGTYKIDLAWGGGDYLFDSQLKSEGFLQGVDFGKDFLREVFPQPRLAGLPLYDTASPPQWIGAALSSFGICYNRDALKYLGLPEPKIWRDLADPRYRGWIVMADPTQSASAKTAYMIVVERAMVDAVKAGRSEDEGWAQGMGQLRQIAANARLFTDSGASPSGIVGNGDVAAAMVIDFYARATIEQVGEDRMGYIEPINATAINPDPIALVKGAEHRETAIHFIQFVLSEEGQRLWIVRAGAPGGPSRTSLRRLPIRKSVYDHPENFVDKVNPFVSASDFNTSNSRKKTFGILGELMQYSMIDLLDELRETRRAILASPRAAELDAKLGLFPFDQKEALRRADLLRHASAVDRMALERQWTSEFREEYRRFRQEAGQ